jgi:hypothetical protein
MKKILISGAALVLLLIAGTLGYLYFSLNGLVKKGVETIGPRVTRTSVRLDAASLSPFSGSGKLEGLLVGNPEGFSGQSALNVPEISVSVDKKSLLTRTIVINEIVIRNPLVSLEGTLTGNNLGKLMFNVKSYGSTDKEKGKPATNSSPRTFIVRKVLISAPRLNVSASLLNQSVGQTVPLTDITLENVGSGGAGISAADLTTQIMVPLLTNALREGVSFVAKQGINTIKQEGLDQLNKAAKGISDFFKRN